MFCLILLLKHVCIPSTATMVCGSCHKIFCKQCLIENNRPRKCIFHSVHTSIMCTLYEYAISLFHLFLFQKISILCRILCCWIQNWIEWENVWFVCLTKLSIHDWMFKIEFMLSHSLFSFSLYLSLSLYWAIHAIACH